MGAFKDLTGTIINNWKVLGLEGMHNNGSYWFCECQCANKTQKVLSLARLKKSKDCGCSKNIDLTGAKIGRWTVVKRVEAEIKYFGIDFAPQQHLFSQYHISFPEDRGET